jgi:hypothetical protein
MKKGFKRPTHEDDAMKVVLSDSVAPELAPLVQKYGDLVAAVIAYSAERSPSFWKMLLIDTMYSRAMLLFFKRLAREGRAVKREWLQRIKAFASRYNDNVAAKRTLYLCNFIAGIKAWSIEIPEYTRELIVDIYERGRRAETLRLPVV